MAPSAEAGKNSAMVRRNSRGTVVSIVIGFWQHCKKKRNILVHLIFKMSLNIITAALTGLWVGDSIDKKPAKNPAKTPFWKA